MARENERSAAVKNLNETAAKRNATDARRWRALMLIMNKEGCSADYVRVDQETVLQLNRSTDNVNNWIVRYRNYPV